MVDREPRSTRAARGDRTKGEASCSSRSDRCGGEENCGGRSIDSGGTRSRSPLGESGGGTSSTHRHVGMVWRKSGAAEAQPRAVEGHGSDACRRGGKSGVEAGRVASTAVGAGWRSHGAPTHRVAAAFRRSGEAGERISPFANMAARARMDGPGARGVCAWSIARGGERASLANESSSGCLRQTIG